VTDPIPLTKAERSALAAMLKRMRLLEVINLLEDYIWKTRMDDFIKKPLVAMYSAFHERTFKNDQNH
jgi:hypothetical protein